MDVIEIHRKKISISAPFSWGTQERVDTAPKASDCILGGTQNDSQGGTGKAEDARTPGAGIISKLCPRKCVVEMEGGSNRPIGIRGRPELRAAAYGTCSTRGRGGQGMNLSQTRSPPGSRLLGGEPSTRRRVVKSVGERGTVGKSKAGACVVGREEFRERGAVQRSWP